jgi:hypothetical protein
MGVLSSSTAKELRTKAYTVVQRSRRKCVVPTTPKRQQFPFTGQLSSKRKVWLMRSPFCVTPITSEPISTFFRNLLGRPCHRRRPLCHNFIPAASTTPKLRTWLLRWMQNLHQSTRDHEILYAERSSKDKQALVRPHLWKTKTRTWRECERWNSYLVFWDNSSTVALCKTN